MIAPRRYHGGMLHALLTRPAVAHWFIALTMCGNPIVALASEPAEATAPPPTYQAVLDCRTVADNAARLACFDKSVSALEAGTRARDVVVIDRATIRATKRGLFGINLPRLNMFGGNDDVEVDQIESTISGTRSTSDGLSVFILADGSRWQQTDGRFTYPRQGQPILIRRAAMGSFMARVNNQPGVRVARLPEK
jgi:hypothetical protein